MKIRSLIALLTTTLFGVFFVSSAAYAARTLEVTVTDQDGAAAPSLWVSGWSDSGSADGWAWEQTDSSGVASWEVATTDDGKWSISTWDEAGVYSDAWVDEVEVSDSGTTSVSLTVEKTDATITVNLVDGSGSAVNVPASGWGSVTCFTDGWENYFWGDIAAGTSSTTVNVVAGTYRCEAWVDEYGGSGADVTIASGETKDASIELLERDATLNLTLVDESGETITSIDRFSAYAYSVADPDGVEYYNDFAWEDGTNGTAELSLLSGGYEYEAGVYVDSGSETGDDGSEGYGDDDGSGDYGDDPGDYGDDTGDYGDDPGDYGDDTGDYDYYSGGLYTTATDTKYVTNYDMQGFVSPASGESISLDFTLDEADATLEVTVLDVDGNPDPYAWVSVIQAGVDDWEGYSGTSADADGVATLYMKNGEYEVYVYPTDAWDDYGDDSDGSGVLPPEDVTVSLGKDETVEITMQAESADHNIEVTANFETDAASLSAAEFQADYFFCFVYSPESGRESWGVGSGSTANIAWTSQTETYVGCDGYDGTTYYRSTDTKVTTGKKDGTTEVAVTLTEAGNYYEDESFTFDNSSGATTLELPDGESELVIPKDALASGSVTITIGSASGLPSSDDDYSAGGWDFEARDSAGELIETFNQDLTLHAKYDEDLLDQIGLDEDSLTYAGFDSDNNSYSSTSSVTVDTEQNVITAGLAHFSTYALLGDKGIASDVLAAPVKMKKGQMSVKKRKKKRVNLRWEAIADAETYTVQVRKCKKIGKKKCKKKKHFQKKKRYRKFKGLTATKKTVKKLKKGTYYQWRIRAINDAGKAPWSKWKRFKTKGKNAKAK